jgi:hypothetical protein
MSTQTTLRLRNKNAKALVPDKVMRTIVESAKVSATLRNIYASEILNGHPLKPNGHKFPYGETVHLKYAPEHVGIVENYSSGQDMPTQVWVRFKDDARWIPEEDLELGSDNPSRRDSW